MFETVLATALMPSLTGRAPQANRLNDQAVRRRTVSR
jgi:hypothetical protein